MPVESVSGVDEIVQVLRLHGDEVPGNYRVRYLVIRLSEPP